MMCGTQPCTPFHSRAVPRRRALTSGAPAARRMHTRPPSAFSCKQSPGRALLLPSQPSNSGPCTAGRQRTAWHGVVWCRHLRNEEMHAPLWLSPTATNAHAHTSFWPSKHHALPRSPATTPSRPPSQAQVPTISTCLQVSDAAYGHTPGNNAHAPAGGSIYRRNSFLRIRQPPQQAEQDAVCGRRRVGAAGTVGCAHAAGAAMQSQQAHAGSRRGG